MVPCYAYILFFGLFAGRKIKTIVAAPVPADI